MYLWIRELVQLLCSDNSVEEAVNTGCRHIHLFSTKRQVTFRGLDFTMLQVWMLVCGNFDKYNKVIDFFYWISSDESFSAFIVSADREFRLSLRQFRYLGDDWLSSFLPCLICWRGVIKEFLKRSNSLLIQCSSKLVGISVEGHKWVILREVYTYTKTNEVLGVLLSSGHFHCFQNLSKLILQRNIGESPVSRSFRQACAVRNEDSR